MPSLGPWEPTFVGSQPKFVGPRTKDHPEFRVNSYIDVDKIVGPFSLVVGLQDRWQPMREDQLALRTNDRWLPEEKGPTTNEKGPTTNADFGWVIPVFVNATSMECQKLYKRVFTFFSASVISSVGLVLGLVILEAIIPIWNQVLRMERPLSTGLGREMTRIRKLSTFLRNSRNFESESTLPLGGKFEFEFGQ